MPLNSTRAIVLQSKLINEQDKLLHLLTAEKGIIKAVAPNAAKSRNRFGSLLELFTEGEFFYYWHEEKEMVTLSKGEIGKSYFDLVSRSENIFYFSMMAEILLRFTPHHYHNPRLYKLMLALLHSRQQGAGNSQLLLYFLVWMLRVEGLLFSPLSCSNCHVRDLERAWMRRDYCGLLCSRCRRDEPDALEKEELAYIRWTRQHPPGASPPLEDVARVQHLIRILTKKLEYHGEFSLTCSRYLPEFK